MGFFSWLLGKREAAHRRAYAPALPIEALGPWAPYAGTFTLPHSRLPKELHLPETVRKWGYIPGDHARWVVLWTYWVRLDPSLVGWVISRLKQASSTAATKSSGKASPRASSISQPPSSSGCSSASPNVFSSR